MSELLALLQELCEAAHHPRRTLEQEMKRTGRKAVGCFPLYTPDEVVDAAGFLPVGLWGGTTQPQLCGQYLQSFCCSVMRANLEQGLSGDYDLLTAVVIPTYCDTLKCICENWKAAIALPPALPVVYPQNRRSAAGEDFLVSEYRRLESKLIELGGVSITEEALQASFDRYEASRAALRRFVQLAALHPNTVSVKARHLVIKSGYFQEKSAYGAKLQRLNAMLEALPNETFHGKRLVVTGLMLEPEAILNLFDEEHVCIVADDLAQESRQFRTLTPMGEDLWHRMAKRYAAQGGDPLLYESEKSRGA
ncbi:MAG: 2-hydroxyacyl-CoA dehydratase family protein, partial [Pygmaiobacter sp.]